MSRFVCLSVAAVITTLSLGFSGCCFPGCGSGGGGWGLIDSFMEKQVSCMRDHVWAKRAFHLRFGHCERVHADHFRDGFVQGYCNVCDGFGGETPALPPEKYWGFRYRSQEGVEMQNAWFAGFDAGSKSAKSDGSDAFHEIQISRQVQQAMLYAEQMEGLKEGIERGYVIDMTPVGEDETSYSTTSTTTLPPVSQGSFAMPQTNMPFITTPTNNMPLAQPMTIPGSSSGFGPNQPLPVQIVPAEVPVIPGQSQR